MCGRTERKRFRPGCPTRWANRLTHSCGFLPEGFAPVAEIHHLPSTFRAIIQSSLRQEHRRILPRRSSRNGPASGSPGGPTWEQARVAGESRGRTLRWPLAPGRDAGGEKAPPSQSDYGPAWWSATEGRYGKERKESIGAADTAQVGELSRCFIRTARERDPAVRLSPDIFSGRRPLLRPAQGMPGKRLPWHTLCSSPPSGSAASTSSRSARPCYFGFAVRGRRVGCFVVRRKRTTIKPTLRPRKSGFVGVGTNRGAFVHPGAGPPRHDTRGG
jgi:hypothetical protein